MKKYAVSYVSSHNPDLVIKIVQSDKGWKDVLIQAFPIPQHQNDISWKDLPDDIDDAKDEAYHWNKLMFDVVEIV